MLFWSIIGFAIIHSAWDFFSFEKRSEAIYKQTVNDVNWNRKKCKCD